MTRQEAQRRAPATFTKRYGGSTMPLELRPGLSLQYGELVCVFDPEDRMLVGYAFERRRRLVQVYGPTGRCQ